MMVSKERRRYPRFTKQFKAHCITTESKRGGDDCTVINVSLKGLGVVFNTSEEIKVGSSVILEIPASEEHEPHSVKGIVKWVKKREKLLKDKIDVTAFMTEFIEKYPESFHEYCENRREENI